MKIASCSKNEDSSEPFKLGQEVSIHDLPVNAKITVETGCG
jgi:hypothetical protein